MFDAPRQIDLEDKYTAHEGRVFLSGTQALVRLPMTQMRRDRAAGLNTGAFISGYRGSPLGGYDQQLMSAKKHLDAHGVVFQPGVNEDLALTAVWGTQQLHLSPGARKDGVLGVWYGKGPGVDRSGDVLKHGNAAGSSRHGGVLCIAGDDHAAKSSTMPHQTDHDFMSALMPVLYPSSVQEFLEIGLLGVAMSRYSGCWVGFKTISDTVETTAAVDLAGEAREFAIPEDFAIPEGGLNLRWPDDPLTQDDRLQNYKGFAAIAFARANRLDRTTLDTPNARFGIVASGKAYEDTVQALKELGIGEAEAAEIGLKLYKVRMPWPLEPEGIRQFSKGLDEVLIMEERREIVENQIKQQLFNWRADVRPRIVGKFDHEDRAFLDLSTPMTVGRAARAVGRRVLGFDFDEGLKARIREKLDWLEARGEIGKTHEAPLLRTPYYCAGCPHNTSTRVPDGSRALAGIGCHYMATWMDRNTETVSQMGGEGVPWAGMAHFTDETHVFANLGDGTYFHSGILAIRQAVASGANITYKVLYNDAVAMTGGQPHDGELSPQKIVHQLHHEGVRPIYLMSDKPEVYSAKELPEGVEILHRDHIDNVMATLRETGGCSAIVYEQTCAAEKRRRRKRGLMEDPPRRVFINPAVCEGCGDCSEQSNCVSIEPLETAMGRKRAINQSSCNKDYSCLKGFCPSFVTVHGGEVRKAPPMGETDASALPEPAIPQLGETPWNIAITGVGGTGVLTIGAVLGMAAHVEGKAPMILDMAGLAQKGGAVMSNLRIGKRPEDVTSPRIVTGGADLLIAADDVVAASKDGVTLCEAGRTTGVVNTRITPVADFVHHRDFDFRAQAVERTIRKTVTEASEFVNFAEVAEAVAGDAIATNIMMTGYAWQKGLIPLELASIRAAIELNGVAVKANLSAFDWGRRLAHDPEAVRAQMPQEEAVAETPLSEMGLDELVAHREAHLTAYQSKRLACRYRALVDKARKAAEGHGESIPRAVATTYAKLLAYKDEYEVGRLFSAPEFTQRLKAQFDGDYRIAFNIAPPFLPGKDPSGRPKKREFGPWLTPAMRALARLKVLRGTPFDPFAYSADRKLERALIAEYEDLADRVLARLTGNNLPQALALLSLFDEIRGFGPVKKAAAEDVRARLPEMLAEYGSDAPDPGRIAAE